SLDLLRHNLGHIFVLTEQLEQSSTDDLRTTKVFKYTSITAIYNQIVAVAGLARQGIKEVQETEVILVYSASGGVGKTTLALGISACLAQSYKRVLYINAERMNTFQHWLENDGALPTSIFTEFGHRRPTFELLKPVVRHEHFDYIPPFGAALSSLNIDLSIFESLIKTAKSTRDYDYIVVDTDGIYDASKAALLTQADKVLMVLNQSYASVYAMNQLLKNVNCANNEKYIFVCNNYESDRPNALVDTKEKPSFIVSEYVDHMPAFDHLNLAALGTQADLQKLAFLLL
ncbi:MAG: AAA family ATPase, partial [Clostridiaceae bacterium]|nr:AAA family ATPase [Clostridiaceae bacterium]